jgi:hypothetical protein
MMRWVLFSLLYSLSFSGWIEIRFDELTTKQDSNYPSPRHIEQHDSMTIRKEQRQ